MHDDIVFRMECHETKETVVCEMEFEKEHFEEEAEFDEDIEFE